MVDSGKFEDCGHVKIEAEVRKSSLSRNAQDEKEAEDEKVLPEQLDIRALFRKKQATSLPRFRKKLRESQLAELSHRALDALAGEVILNRQLPRLSTMMLSLMTGGRSEPLAIQLVELSARVVARATEATRNSDEVRSCPILRTSADVIQFAMEEVPRVKGEGSRHNLAVLIALTSIQAGFMQLDDLTCYITTVLARRTKTVRPHVSEASLHEALLYNMVRQTDLTAALNIRAVYEEIVRDLRHENEHLKSSGDVLERRLATTEAAFQEQKGQIRQLQEKLTALERDIEGLEQDLVSQKTSSLYELQTVKARMMGVFDGELTRWLATAQDAATADPPHGRVVVERLEQALRKIKGEVQWLQSSV